jgi:hypothetical protein
MVLLLNEIYPRSAFTGIAGSRAIAINQGHFRIIGPGTYMLLPSLWERTVKPGWKVTFRFVNPNLNVIKETVERERPRNTGERAALSLGNREKFFGER